MRNSDRIDPALARLRDVWSAHPDLRLGQLLVNAAQAGRGESTPCPDLFYMEDDDLLSRLEDGLVGEPVGPSAG